MSAVNNQPATPLPWQIGVFATAIVDGSGRNVASTEPYKRNAERREISDAAYIARAANAYPTLIEALHDTFDAYYSAAETELHAIQRAEALLVKLGERI